MIIDSFRKEYTVNSLLSASAILRNKYFKAFLFYFVVPEKKNPPTETIEISKGMGMAKDFNTCKKLGAWRGIEVFVKIRSPGEVWLFSGTKHNICNSNVP